MDNIKVTVSESNLISMDELYNLSIEKIQPMSLTIVINVPLTRTDLINIRKDIKKVLKRR